MTHPTDDELEAMAKYHDWRNAEIDAILAALDFAPDHSDWNAAIEAAAKVVPQGWCQPSTSHIEMDVDLGQGIQEAIRALKKGQTND